MWIMLNNAFLSVVKKDCGPGKLLVRARRAADIRRIFPGAKVQTTPRADYRYRAVVPVASVSLALDREVRRIAYDNFKDSVTDARLHSAYLQVWHDMASIQATPPYQGGSDEDALFDHRD